MTTLAGPATKLFGENTIEKQCYKIAESFKEFIPVTNDRNRLGFNLYRFVTGEGDAPEVIVPNIKIKLEGISQKDLAAKLNEALKDIKK